MHDIFDRVRALAAGLPGAEESTHYGTAAFKVRKKMFVRIHDKMGDVLVIRIGYEDRDRLIAADPEKYFITPHYDGYPAMLVRLPAVDDDELRTRVHEAWTYVSSAGR